MPTTIEIIREEAGAAVQMEDRLDSLGLDSLDLLELVNRIEEAHQLEIPPALLMAMETVADLVNFVRKANLAQV